MRGRFLNRLDLETSDEVVRLLERPLEAFTVLALHRSAGPVAREHT
jgi:hypothetical protein